MKPDDAELQALDEIFRARSVAVVGASTDTSKFGGMTLKTLIGAGYDGKIYPVNSRRDYGRR
jgi:acyl-CoA synthetase (NDP forming)